MGKTKIDLGISTEEKPEWTISLDYAANNMEKDELEEQSREQDKTKGSRSFFNDALDSDQMIDLLFQIYRFLGGTIPVSPEGWMRQFKVQAWEVPRETKEAVTAFLEPRMVLYWGKPPIRWLQFQLVRWNSLRRSPLRYEMRFKKNHRTGHGMR